MTTEKDMRSARYFHGGAPGLRVGDLILPPTKTGAASNADYGAALRERQKGGA